MNVRVCADDGCPTIMQDGKLFQWNEMEQSLIAVSGKSSICGTLGRK